MFAPVTVTLPLDPSMDSPQLNVDPPPTKFWPPIMLILPVPVPAVVVNPVGAALLNPPAPMQDKVPPLKVKFLVPAPVTKDEPTVRVFPFRSSVAVERVNDRVEPAPEGMVSASSSRYTPPLLAP